MSSTNTDQGDTGINALSLDGGSIASLMSSLELLEELMRRIQRELGLSDPPLPCNHFRLMVGAGFAGLLAILLGRLGMSVQEARHHCVAIMDEAFSEKKPFGNGTFKMTKLRAAVERMLELCEAGASARMLDPRVNEPETCKVMVCVAPESGMRAGMPARLRTYAADVNGIPDCTIIEAICSTFAVSGLFKPMDVVEPGDIKSTYVGLSDFNPMAWLLDEAANLFRNGHLKCAMSTGASQKQASATECERVAEEMSVRFMDRPGHYFRLSVDQGMGNIKTTDWERRMEGTTHARSYLQIPENEARMAKIAHAVVRNEQGVSTTHLRGSIPKVSMVRLCPAPSSLFVGRGDLLSRLARCLDDTQERRVCVLHGLGGVGKTQLALKFVEAHTNDYDHIFYVDCTSKHTIDADFKLIALANNVGDCAKHALTWLARLQERWLIVYNNADDTSVNLRGYFPSCLHGNILITTRNRGLVNLAQGTDANCHVSNMSEDEAKGLLAEAARLEAGVGAAGVALVELLGYFPLAIVQAGAYIQTNMCSIQDYLAMYQTSRGEILEDYANEAQKLDDYELTVYATWQVSHQKLSPLARQLYDYLAFMHHDKIVEDIFRFAVQGLNDWDKHPLPPTDEEEQARQAISEFLANFTSLVGSTWDKAAFLQTIKDLTSYSLLLYDEADCSYSIHPLVQQWTRTVVVDPGAMCSRVAFLLASSVTGDKKTEDYAYRRVLLNHIDRLPDSERLRPRLAWRLHRVYGESRRAKDQERLVQAEYEANLRVLGRDNFCTLLSMAKLAQAYSSQGRWGEAEVLQREVLEARKRVLSIEHSDTLIGMGNLAQTYWSQGRRREAEVLQREVLEVGKRVWGSEHPHTLTSMGNLASTYLEQGWREEAEVLQREVLEVGKRVWGSKHPDTLISMGNLARTYSEQGRWGEAEVLLREMVEVRKRVLGNKHPETLIAMGSLAWTYSNQGRRGEAEVLQREVLEVGKRVWGSEHPDTLKAMGNLASTYWEQGRRGEAEVLQREVLEVGKRVWGSKHPDTLIATGNLAVTCASQGRWKEAEVFLIEVVEIGKRVWGDQHPDILLWTQGLDRIRSHLAQSDIPAAMPPAEADNSAQLLETGIRTQSRKRRRSIKESTSQKKRH